MGVPLLPALLFAAFAAAQDAPPKEPDPSPLQPKRIEARIDGVIADAGARPAPPPAADIRAVKIDSRPEPERMVRDLSGDFIQECRLRAQTGTESCHAFASIALLEAALKRNGKPQVRLSPADLFTRVALARGDYTLKLLDDGGVLLELNEGGSPLKDIEFAFDEGVAAESVAPWDKFLEGFRKYRQAKIAECSRLLKESGKTLRACTADDESALMEFLDGLKGDAADAEREKLLDAPARDLKASRERMEDAFDGMSVESKGRASFGAATAEDAADAGACREKGRKQAETLTEQLDAGRPLIACFNMGWMSGWKDHVRRDEPGPGPAGGEDDKKKRRRDGTARHCVAVTGYSTVGNGAGLRKRFKTINSWSPRVVMDPPVAPNFPATPRAEPVAYDLLENEACGINELVWIEP